MFDTIGMIAKIGKVAVSIFAICYVLASWRGEKEA